MYGPVKEGQRSIIRRKEEIKDILQEARTAKFMKSHRLSWYCLERLQTQQGKEEGVKERETRLKGIKYNGIKGRTGSGQKPPGVAEDMSESKVLQCSKEHDHSQNKPFSVMYV
jgi:hypothetical protein